MRRQMEARFQGEELVEVRRVGHRVDRYQELPSVLRVGGPLTTIARHGKFLVLGVRDKGAWVVHLGMSGRPVMLDSVDPDPPHLTFEFCFGDVGVGIIDPRTFGSVRFVREFSDCPCYVSVLSHFGPDPLTQVDEARNNLSLVLTRTRRAVKTVLLDQRVIAGVGNMYADEALYRARVAPNVPGLALGARARDCLFDAITDVFDASIDKGGTSFPDRSYRDLAGELGRFGPELAVYMRAGKSCSRCQSTVLREEFGRRHSYRCPVCQVYEGQLCT